LACHLSKEIRNKLAIAWRHTRQDYLGFAYAQDAFKAQSTFTYWEYYKRESGRVSWRVEDIASLASDYHVPAAELVCRWLQAYDGTTFGEMAVKVGLTTRETQRRFEARLKSSGLPFEQLYLLVMSDQVGL